jgi:hypothetical protein
MELAKGTDYAGKGACGRDFARSVVYFIRGQVLQIRGPDFGRGSKESARVSPESATAHEASRDSLLRLFVKVLAGVRSVVHFPCNEIFLVVVKGQMGLVVGFSYPVPRFGENVSQPRCIGGQIQPDVEVRDTASLELQNPQIRHIGKTFAKICQPCVEVFFHRETIWTGFVVGQTKLRYQLFGRVASKEPKPTAGGIRKALDT